MKIDLSNCTFIIPIQIESDDRLRNVITSTCFLLSNFDTKIIIKELDRESVFAEKALPQIEEFCGDVSNLTHIFEKSTSDSFHRQKVLNDMILESSTKVVVNYDCDIILPIESYVKSYQAIVDDELDVVYPYGDGDYQVQVFADDEIVTDFLVNDFNFKYLEEKSKIHDAKYGFCQFFNRKVYIDGGMENENFVAYAPEDVERYYRYVTLGYRVGRLPSFVYHLEHKRTHNSWFNNPMMDSNSSEWEKIKTMNKSELIEYYKNQEYLKKRK